MQWFQNKNIHRVTLPRYVALSRPSEHSERRATNAPERDLYSTRSHRQSGGDRGRGGTCCARLATLHCVYVRHCFNSIRLQSIRHRSENTAYLLHSLESSAKSVTVKIVLVVARQ